MKKWILAFLLLVPGALPCNGQSIPIGALSSSHVASGPTPIGRWLLNEGGAATIATDSSGNGNNGTWGGTKTSGSYYTTSALAPLAYAGYFSAANNNYVNLGTPAALVFDRGNSFSGCVWLNTPSTVGGTAQILSQQQATPPYSGWTFVLAAGNVLNFFVYADASHSVDVAATSGITAGAWHHVCFTYSGNSSASGVALYVDGAAVSTTAPMDTLSLSISNSGLVEIGALSSAYNFFPGLIEDVRIYGTTLTSAQVAAIYAAGPGR